MFRRTSLPPAAALAGAALVAGALGGCGGSANNNAGGASSSSTPSATGTSASPTTPAQAAEGIPCSAAGQLDSTPKMQPPKDLPILPGGHVYLSKGPFGKTSLFFAWKEADPKKLDAARDAAAAALVAKGYHLMEKDQEEGSEAEAHLTGPHTVAIQVIQLCDKRVRVKYVVS